MRPKRVLDQRAQCGHSAFWDIRWALPSSNGARRPTAIWFEADDGSHYCGNAATLGETLSGPASSATAVLDDGATHLIIVARRAGQVTVSVDGVAGTAERCAAAFGALAPLHEGTGPCVGVDGTAALDGVVADVCTSR